MLSAYVVVLLFAARRAEQRCRTRGHERRRAVSYALSLASPCTAWIYYGDGDLAIRSGWNFVPNLLGPILGFTIMWLGGRSPRRDPGQREGV